MQHDDTIETIIRDYIAENILFSGDGYPYSDDASFSEEGIVDSMNVLELVMLAGDRFGITVDDMEITSDNFDSVTRLTSYIRGKMAARE